MAGLFDWGGQRLFVRLGLLRRSSTSIAETLVIRMGKAYVDQPAPPRRSRKTRGDYSRSPGTDSPYRDRTPEENLELVPAPNEAPAKFPDGAHLLRAKIDMASPNMNLRDPAVYRIQATPRIIAPGTSGASIRCTTGPTGSSDSIEGITHSICTLEFENHRPLYDWFLDHAHGGPQAARAVRGARAHR